MSIVVFSKVEPFIVKLRRISGSEKYLKNPETPIMKMPVAEQMKRRMQARAETAKNA